MGSNPTDHTQEYPNWKRRPAQTRLTWRFDSVLLYFAAIAQLVEHRSRKPAAGNGMWVRIPLAACNNIIEKEGEKDAGD